ncbi:MAG: hypothetical protein ACREJN_21400 [Nitrospiraceae bacterium]
MSSQAVSDQAVQFFLSAARHPGLDVVGIDVYSLCMDMAAVIRNVMEYYSRIPVLKLYAIPDEVLPIVPAETTWRFLSSQDESGTLHRWRIVDYIPDDPLADLHSWEVAGDIIVAQAPMVLHYIAIGRREKSHQQSPWCRAYAHPTVANVIRFNRLVAGYKGELRGNWKPIYFSVNEQNTSKAWVDWMEKDDAVTPLLRNVHVQEIAEEHQNTFYRDLRYELQGMSSLAMTANPKLLPMSRRSCDVPYACPHQPYCYSSVAQTLEGAGIYRKASEESMEVYA